MTALQFCCMCITRDTMPTVLVSPLLYCSVTTQARFLAMSQREKNNTTDDDNNLCNNMKSHHCKKTRFLLFTPNYSNYSGGT